MTTATVYIINGKPRSGKDTLQDYMSLIYRAQGAQPLSFSSIDPVRNALTAMGVDTTQKTHADRALLATVGKAVEDHSAFRTKACVEFVKNHPCPAPGFHVVFLMIREPDIIRRVRHDLRVAGHQVHRILVISNRAEVPVTEADALTDTMPYDFLLVNNGTLPDLHREAASLIDLVTMKKVATHAA